MLKEHEEWGRGLYLEQRRLHGPKGKYILLGVNSNFANNDYEVMEFSCVFSFFSLMFIL